jgi:hypothetical protein
VNFAIEKDAALESCITDQYIHGLGNFELQKHVQFQHPITLDMAISSAVEYCALQGSLDKILKPIEEEYSRGATHSPADQLVSFLRPLNMKTDCSLEDLQQMLLSLLDQKMGQKLTEKLASFQNKNVNNALKK